MIVLENASAGYITNSNPVVAADGINLTVGKNQIVGIAGESGCGKSTLLKLIYGQVGRGMELFSGTAKWKVAEDEYVGLDTVKSLWWDRITYIPQAVNTLNPIMKIEDQLMDCMPARLKNRGR